MSAAPAILNTAEITAKFSESLRTLAKLQGFSEQTVTLAEVGVVLKTCVGRTKVTKPEATDRRSRLMALRGLKLTRADRGGVSVNVGPRGIPGFVWYRTDGPHPRSQVKGGAKVTGRPWQLAGVISADGQKFTESKLHFKPSAYFKIKSAVFDAQEAIKLALPRGVASVGLARQSWVQIADDAGIILEDIPGGTTSARAIQKARAAIASNGRTMINGIGSSEYIEQRNFIFTLKNRLPYNLQIGLDGVLLGVLAGRAKFFEENVKRGVFASHTETVKKYPWLKLVGAE